MTGLADFRIELDPTGAGSVVINGQELSTQLKAFTLQNKAGQPPVLVVQLVPGSGEIKGSGIVQVPYESEEAGMRAVNEFLLTIDEGHLEQEVLSRMDGFAGDSPVVTALQVIREWAHVDLHA